jgi:hypothetical protein
MTKSVNSFLKPSMNWLLVFIPITLFMEHAMPDKPVLVFFCAALSIVPIASLIVSSSLSRGDEDTDGRQSVLIG